ncbi:hypothetical protein [Flavobacterium sp. JAS]|uniref:hypothetical protein n=1 Tax=Flavobacterium sp. JAS TaxID=2897329 RepID=UPI001E54A3B2|nr:hypothetical protein [Flavobacterium sp. JAS]MCD0468334.1 hypothetical protein [Flavobacterium sp. JAS]
MNRKHKITIPEPCYESWDKMTPKDNGRFCMSCSKTVIDFTTKLPDEIQQFFAQNQNTGICGRFKNEQLDSVIIQIPSHIVYAQTNYYKMFLLALFLAMGTTLFSCQNKEGKKQKIDKVEVVQDDASTEHVTVGLALPPKHDPNDTLRHVPPPPPPKVDQVKFVKPKEKIKSDDVSQGEVYVTGAVIHTNAEFPGGIDPFYTFFGKEFKTPENTNTKNLKIRISFAVEKNGTLSYIESVPAINKNIENEIIRVLSLSPKWQPGESNGKKIRMQYSLPIVLE